MKIFRQPGHSVEVDYSGNSLEINNPATGEITKVELFVGALTYSSYFYAEFTYTQKLDDFIDSQVRMFEYFGGVPEFVVPDNCLTAVTKAEKHDVKLNESYHDMCKHYKAIVDPARVRRPQDKPVVEKSVDIIQKDFFPRVRSRTFTSLHELNQAMRGYLEERMKVTMRERNKSRLELFSEEKVLLRALPDHR
jgi:transposase